MVNENELLQDFLNYCIKIIGQKEWDRRFANISDYHIALKTGPIILLEKPNKRAKTFVSQQYLCKDLSMWYLYNIYNYVHNPDICDLGLISRTIPKVLRISEALSVLIKQNGFEKKVKHLLLERCKEIDNIFFEILVACLYLRNKVKKVDFLFDKSRKYPDLLATFNNGELYIECKKKSKESEYVKREREYWYTQYLPVQDYLQEKKIPLVLRIIFHKEMSTYEDDFLYKTILPYLKDNSNGMLIDNDQITVTIYKPYFDRVNNNNMTWKAYSPLFMQNLFDFKDDKYGITSCYIAKRGNRLSDYISKVEYASAGLWTCDSPEAIRKRSFSFKRHICESIEQIPAKNNGVIHICYESYDGQTVEKLNFDRTYNDLKELNIKNKIIKYVYLHNLRFFWPPDKNWEVEEEVYPFTSNFFIDEYFIKCPHIVAYP